MNLKILCKNLCHFTLSSHSRTILSNIPPTSYLQAPSAFETKSLREVYCKPGLISLDLTARSISAGCFGVLRQKREALFKFTVETQRDPRTHPSSPTGTTDRCICTLLAALEDMEEQEAPLLWCTSMCRLEKGRCCNQHLWSSIRSHIMAAVTCHFMKPGSHELIAVRCQSQIVCRRGRACQCRTLAASFSLLIDLVSRTL